ncbi:MAG TPA: DivIVA domain-containing protein [Jiangellaceae bacterium]|nr:DivIVA domain-containing protein [Jiangellaceae bacterium]
MYLVFVAAAALVIFAGAAFVVGRESGLADEPRGIVEPALPSGRIGPTDLDEVRFAVVPRGYRMEQVDDVLDRLRVELAVRDERIAELETARSRPDA